MYRTDLFGVCGMALTGGNGPSSSDSLEGERDIEPTGEDRQFSG